MERCGFPVGEQREVTHRLGALTVAPAVRIGAEGDPSRAVVVGCRRLRASGHRVPLVRPCC